MSTPNILDAIKIEAKIENKKLFIVIGGVAGIGKSTFIDEELNEFSFDEFSVIGFDKTLNDVYFREETYTEKNQKWLASSKVEKGLFNLKTRGELMQNLLHKKNIVIDQTNLTNVERVDWLKYVDQRDFIKVFIRLTADKETIFNQLDKRDKEEGKHIPKDVIEKMIEREEFEDNNIIELYDYFNHVLEVDQDEIKRVVFITDD